MFNILLFGCSKIGARNLQGLVIKNIKLNILVIDSSNSSLNKGKEKWIEAGGNNSKHKINWSNKPNSKYKKFDLAIIATSSKNRAIYIKKLSKKFKIKYWLIEKVLTQSVKEAYLLNDLIKKNTAYINFSRREMNWYKKMKFEFKDKNPLRITKTGGLWGLACNSIHFIDLMSWFTDEQLISINTKKLKKKWFPSKRLGFYEIYGEIIAKFSNGSKLILNSDPNEKNEIIKVKQKNKKIWRIDEKNGKAYMLNKEKFIDGKIDYQSELTKKIVTKLLTTGKLNLPSLDESLNNHEIFLSSMLSHWNKSNNLNDTSLLIT